MNLEIITPEKKIYNGEVDVATLPGSDGSFQVMNNHAPLISILSEGTLVYKTKDKTEQITITGGVVEILANKMIVLVDGIKED